MLSMLFIIRILLIVLLFITYTSPFSAITILPALKFSFTFYKLIQFKTKSVYQLATYPHRRNYRIKRDCCCVDFLKSNFLGYVMAVVLKHPFSEGESWTDVTR